MTSASQSFRCRIAGIGAFGPLFRNWPELSHLLTGGAVSEQARNAQPPAEIISANERRRAPLIVRLAVETSWQACQQANVAADSISSVFVSGLGDTSLGDYCCRELARDAPQLSPTKFHNSVHNAPAGYWTISTGCTRSASTLAGFRESVGVALLESLMHCVVEHEPVLVTVVDIPVALAQREMLRNDEPFSLAMVLQPDEPGTSGQVLAATVVQATPDSGSDSRPASEPGSNSLPDSLDALYQNNPAARILTLARQLASRPSPTPRGTESIHMALSAATSLELTLG